MSRPSALESGTQAREPSPAADGMRTGSTPEWEMAVAESPAGVPMG